jgi:hypothetical protein
MNKATLRISGNHMITARITVHVGIDKISDVIAYQMANDREIPKSRAKLFAIVLDHIKDFGNSWFAEGRDIDEVMDEAKALAEKMFPELKKKAA